MTDDQSSARASSRNPVGHFRRRAEARAAARRMMATGAPEAADVTRMTWRVRTSRQLDAVVCELSRRTGRTRSAIIREAVEEYARIHG